LSRRRPERDPEVRIHRTRGARRRRWIFISVGIVVCLIIAVVALIGGSYWWFTAKVTVANQRTPENVEEALTAAPSTTLVSIPESKEAMNIILLGSDNRAAGANSGGRSDTIMVLHVDPELDFATLLSIPRDLWVDIPGHNENRVNAAYAFGGAELTIRTVKNLLGLDINKYVEVGFGAFEKMIDSLGGVYVDVDRKYDDEEPRPTHLNAGYQLLRGADALLFARYRFDSNADFGRMTRQQRVLAAVREQAMGWNLPLKVPGIGSSVLDETATNLTANEMIDLAYWLVKLDGDRMKQIVITLPSTTIEGRSVLVPEKDTLKDAVTKLLTDPTESDTAVADGASGNATTTETSSGSSTSDPAASSSTTTKSQPSSTSSTSKTSDAGSYTDGAMWRSAQKNVSFALEAPGFVPSGFAYAYKMPSGSGTYQIDPSGDSKPAIRMLYRYKNRNLFLGITATTWTDAPAASKGQEVEKNGVKFTVVGTSGKVDRIWWKKDGVLYFISNTLMYTVNRSDLLKMAESMLPVGDAE